MSGICGVVLGQAGERMPESDVLAGMVRALGFNRSEIQQVELAGEAGMGLLKERRDGWSGGARLVVQGQPVVLMVHGTLFSHGFNRSAGEGAAGTLLRSYLDKGIGAVHDVRGDFSAAVWDGRSHELFLITDRFRVHPLFYYEGDGRLIYASRMKSLLAAPFPLQRSINPYALVDVMAFSAITADRTVFREVKKLPPGHLLVWRDRAVSIRQYWDVDFLNPYPSPESVLKEQLKAEFDEAIAARLEADAGQKIGAFLSGGIDSSTVTGVMTRLTKGPVPCFSIGFAEQRFNEMEYARIAARHFGSEHHEYYVTPQDTYDAIPKLLDSFDEPFANASAIPTYFCAKMAVEHGVDAMYAGDGGDELFAGNERYSSQRIFDYYTSLPRVLRDWAVKPAVTALADMTGLNLFVLGKKYIRRASIPLPDRLYSYGLFNVLPIGDLLEGDVVHALGAGYDPYTPTRNQYFKARASTDLDRFLYVDLKITISDNDLFKVTRMTQAAGVAVRFPFLDHKLAEFAGRVPAKIKMPARELRVFFKNAYSDLLPQSILTKTKHGFGLPIPVWLRTDKGLNEMMHELVLGARTVQRGMFKKKALEDLVAQHREEAGSFYGDILWNVMVWELWLRSFWDGRPEA